MKIYFNGVEDSTLTLVGIRLTNNGALWIAWSSFDGNESGGWYNGKFSNLQIHTKALTS